MEDESQAVKEYRQAFDEFFKDKPKPKDKEESKKMLDEFFHWYNNERKQSDTGKTPAEMYKEIYGKEAPEPTDLTDDEDFSEEEINDIYSKYFMFFTLVNIKYRILRASWFHQNLLFPCILIPTTLQLQKTCIFQ